VLCVNLRYSLYGLSLLDTFKGAGFWTRAYLIAGITDETYALEVACKLPPEGKRRYCLFLTALDHMYWIIGVTAGALAGAALPVPSKGIDFAMTSLFLVILTEQCRERANRLPAIIGGVSAIAVFIVLALVFLTTIVAKREPDGQNVACLEALYLGFATFAFIYSLMLPSRLLSLQLARFDELVESRRSGQKSE
jgi:4-azaleucine resistance transporter AzlC